MDSVGRHHLFILNPRSFPLPGSLERMTERISAFFTARGEENYSIKVSTYPREAIILIREYIGSLASSDRVVVRVYAVGGDGIAFDCLNGIAGLPNTELALLPYGSSNDFVRNFSIGGDETPSRVLETFRNLELQTAAPTIATDYVRHTNGPIVICSLCDCLLGVEAAAAYNIVNLTKKSAMLPGFIRRLSKSVLYTTGGLMAVFDEDLIHQEYHIIADGKDISGRYATINISNIPCYGGDKNPVVTANPTDGWLDVLTTKSITPLHLVSVFTKYLAGKRCKNDKIFTLRRVKKISITPASPQLMVNLDGEAFFDTASNVEVVPGGVNIAAPGGARYRTWGSS
jgi:diacylglycerol kinase family enzyme